MCAVLNKGYTFGATETVTSAKLSALVDSGTVSNIQAADISSGAITDAKVNDVSGSKFTNLSAIPGGAGVIPLTNIPNIPGTQLTSLSGIPSGAGYIPTANLASIPASLFANLASIPSAAGQFPYYSMVSSLASGGFPIYNGANNFVGHNLSSVLRPSSFKVRITANGTPVSCDETGGYDNNNDFTSNAFTAPVTGRYLFAVEVQWTRAAFGAGATYPVASLRVNSSIVHSFTTYAQAGASSGNYAGSTGGSVVLSLTAGDTIDLVAVNDLNNYNLIPNDITKSFWSGALLNGS